ncbi:MAG: YjjI family glycine radical enzyme [Bacillota bacterium]|nr:YjjI family glycine radical enzyme [Bacillota bacterium]
MNDLMRILKDPKLTYRQRLFSLSKAAENIGEPVKLSEKAQRFADCGIIYDMGEGNTPYCPRYVVPDYDKFLKQGSKFLMLAPPSDIWEAVSNLQIIYHHVPSVIGLPVYIGHLDRLLEPYIADEKEARRAIRMLLTHVDRTVSDSFCHCDIGPYDTRAGRIILELTEEMQRPVPNMSLIYNEKTPDEFALRAISAGLTASKPSFVNDGMYSAEWGESYAVVSCYNVLPIGGGGLTLGRLNLKKLADASISREQLMNELLPDAVLAQCEQMDKRESFIIDECRFFENSFLAAEELIYPERFVGMFGLVGLAECVNKTLGATAQEKRYGHCEQANAFGEEIIDRIDKLVSRYKPKHGKFYLHGQVGISSDEGVTPNTRIPVGEEPDLPTHLMVTARMQKKFPCGIGDIFPFEATAKRNPKAVLDIIKGAFSMNMRYLSFYSSDSDVIRISGYLVKRSDILKYKEGKAVLSNSASLGSEAAGNLHAFERKVRSSDDA